MAVLTADHFIADEAGFRDALAAAVQTASTGTVVTLGITPTYPSTGFGYIECGDIEQQMGDLEVCTVQRFAEKTDEQTARAFLESGRYSWNSGMFIWSLGRVMAEFALHAPGTQ